MALNTAPPIGNFPGAQQRFGFTGTNPGEKYGAYSGGGGVTPGGPGSWRLRRPNNPMMRYIASRLPGFGGVMASPSTLPVDWNHPGGGPTNPPPPSGGTGGGDLIGIRDPNPRPPVVGGQPYIPPTPGSGYTPGGGTGGNIGGGTIGGGGEIPGVPGWPGDSIVGVPGGHVRGQGPGNTVRGYSELSNDYSTPGLPYWQRKMQLSFRDLNNINQSGRGFPGPDRLRQVNDALKMYRYGRGYQRTESQGVPTGYGQLSDTRKRLAEMLGLGG